MIIVRLKSFFDDDYTLNQREIIINSAIDNIEALRAENARLKSALKPFADKANKAEEPFAPPYPEDYPLWRAARAAMGESDE